MQKKRMSIKNKKIKKIIAGEKSGIRKDFLELLKRAAKPLPLKS